MTNNSDTPSAFDKRQAEIRAEIAETQAALDKLPSYDERQAARLKLAQLDRELSASIADLYAAEKVAATAKAADADKRERAADAAKLEAKLRDEALRRWPGALADFERLWSAKLRDEAMIRHAETNEREARVDAEQYIRNLL